MRRASIIVLLSIALAAGYGGGRFHAGFLQSFSAADYVDPGTPVDFVDGTRFTVLNASVAGTAAWEVGRHRQHCNGTWLIQNRTFRSMSAPQIVVNYNLSALPRYRADVVSFAEVLDATSIQAVESTYPQPQSIISIVTVGRGYTREQFPPTLNGTGCSDGIHGQVYDRRTGRFKADGAVHTVAPQRAGGWYARQSFGRGRIPFDMPPGGLQRAVITVNGRHVVLSGIGPWLRLEYFWAYVRGTVGI